MISKVTLTYLILLIVAISLVQAGFTDVPRKSPLSIEHDDASVLSFIRLAPPKRPERFHSREELKRYLQKVSPPRLARPSVHEHSLLSFCLSQVHEYHLVLGRWRIRRSADQHPATSDSNDDLFRFFDINKDHVISQAEFAQRLKSKEDND